MFFFLTNLISDNIFFSLNSAHQTEIHVLSHFSVHAPSASKHVLSVTIRQTGIMPLLCVWFQRARNSAHHHRWVKTLQNTNFSGVKKSCLVLSMTTKQIFQFIQWDFKGFHKTKCGGGFSSRRGACNSSIEVKTWKSPKLESHFHRHSSCLHLQIE